MEIKIFSFKRMHLKILSAKWQSSCLCLNILNLPTPVMTQVPRYHEMHSSQVPEITSVAHLFQNICTHGDFGNIYQDGTSKLANFLKNSCAHSTTSPITAGLPHWGETKWPPFCWGHLQIHLCEWKLFCFYQNFTEISFQWSNPKQQQQQKSLVQMIMMMACHLTAIISSNSSVPSRHHTGHLPPVKCNSATVTSLSFHTGHPLSLLAYQPHLGLCEVS